MLLAAAVVAALALLAISAGGENGTYRVRAIFEPAHLPEADVAGPEALRALFAGPDLFLHLREDAAALLWERTGGVRARVAEELGDWLR